MSKNVLVFIVLFILIFSTLAVSADFMDDFSDIDYAANGWNMELLFGKPNDTYIVPGRRMLTFHMPDYNTAIYMLNEKTNAADSSVEVTYENVFSNHGEFGLICRYQEKGWYELRVYLSGPEAGSYALYRYDRELREEGKNPFVNLTPKLDRIYTNALKTGNNAVNTLKMICEGNEIRIFINGKEQLPLFHEKFHAGEYKDGISGFSVWSQTPRAYAQINVTEFKSVFEAE